MPPKPLAEDLARKKAERDKQRKAEEALAVLEKPSGFEQAVAAVKDPVGTVKQLGRVAKETFYDPVNRAQRAVNPFEDLTPMQRATGIAEGALVAADFFTPGVPEGAIARNLQREAMEKALDREVASYASRGGGAKYRGGLILHGSPEPALDVIEARKGSFALPDINAAYGIDVGGALQNNDLARLEEALREVDKYSRGATRRAAGEKLGDSGTLYVGRVPKENRIIRGDLPSGTVQIADDRFDNYIVSSQDVPVLAKSNTQNYWGFDFQNYKLPKNERIQGPAIPTYQQDFGDGWVGSLDRAQSSAFGALLNAKLRPGERKQIERALAELLSRRRYDTNNISDF